MLAGRFGFAEHLDEYGKRDFALPQGFAPERCAAVGDSQSDLPAAQLSSV
ncbi:hypothetical protein [Amycolatopsis mediterranei]|uniref:Uncharacterized protein n=1 Tax=Amycolatopsis mediterranei (strain S699) TaxID=713604 RepID=A0A9R0P211_AMYMS|nr:hypothetical protein [Amycolatopsis mediterranei]AEK44734.1 hypothetical protein RAM_31295 [Amycolatopsis mediterranei S699]UZF72850.1 haloacid dehalogenase-like hydrolase [Amycolatopsis mediterranei]